MHCIAHHKLELAVLMLIGVVRVCRNLKKTLENVFNFYHFLPKRRRELKEVAEVFQTDLANLSGIISRF